MSRIPTHLIAYSIQNIIERKMRSLKVPRPKAVAEDLVPAIIDEIPSEAFDPRDISEDGLLIFHGDVDEDRCRTMQEAILETHLNVKKDTPITLMLSTLGGDVYAGLALASTIQHVRRAGRKVNVHIQGYAMSMGTLMAQAADYRCIDAHGWFMIHEMNECDPPKNIKTQELKDLAETVERMEIQAFGLYATRSGKPVPYWRKRVSRRDVYLTAEQALAEGLVDEILHAPPFRRQRQRKATSSMSAAAQSSSTR